MKTEKYQSSLEERVKKGVEVLDRVEPDWWKKIELPKLDIQRCESCVLGQVFSSYTHGLNRIFDAEMPHDTENFPGEFAIECGWEVDVEGLSDLKDAVDDDDGVPFYAFHDYDALGVLWAAVVRERQNVAQV